MKFLCDNCKAKYQIADDKVAGKTVRMKCRKCGHLIEIRASVTDASVATGMPAEAVLSDRPPSVVPAEPTAIPRPGALPRTSGPSPVKRPAPSAGAPKPAAPSPSAPKAAPRPGGGLASAFNKSVKDEPKPIEEVTRALDLATLTASEEWYVGVNGVPLGPLRASEIRAKAQTGAITEDSLVWREGFEEWLAIKTFPELVALLPATSTSHIPPPASARAASLSNPGQRRSSNAPPPRSNVIPFSRAATAEKLEPAPETALADPFAAPPPAVAIVPTPASSSAVEAFAPPPAADSAIGPSELPPARRSGGIPPAAWVAIVAALALGTTAGSILFSKAPPPPTVQIVTVTASTPAPPPPGSAVARPDPAAPDLKPDPTAPVKTGGPRVAGPGPVAPPPDKKDDPPPAPLPGGPAPLPGGPSPLPGPGGPGGPTPGGGDQLSQADVQRVVNNGRNSLKRACWEPALAAKSANAPSSAKVTVTLTIGPDGRVRSSSASGGDGYPGLASCIGGRVRSWVFPASSGETTVAPSFTFVPQLVARDPRRPSRGAPRA